MARIRKQHGVGFSGDGGGGGGEVESVDSDVECENETNEDMEIDEKDGEVREGLVGSGDVDALIGEGLVSEAKESSKEVEGLVVSSDEDGVCEDEASKECVDGNRSSSFDVTIQRENEREKEHNADIDELVRDGELKGSPRSEAVTCDGVEDETLEADVEVKTDEGVNDLVDMDIDLDLYSGNDGSESDDTDVSGPAKPKFKVFDLVWGKVRSHPWWPGQICDPSVSSEQAKKHFKKHSYLITYFWDCTFAWNEASQMKPFFESFSQMQKQSNTEEFQNAVDCALEEVSRRVEFGLACSCISEEVYAKLKTQTIVNAGIKEEAASRDGGDNSLVAASFEPSKLVNFVKQATKLPFGRTDKLELVTSWAQLSSFCRWKGYPPLPQFNVLGGLLEHDADISLLREKEQCNEPMEDALPVIKDDELERKSKGKNFTVYKRRHSEDSSKPSKKGKNSAHAAAEKCLSTPKSEDGSESKAGGKSVSQPSSKKRKAIISAISDDSAVKQSKMSSLAVYDSSSLQKKQTFKVGERICRVATLLNRSRPIFRPPIAAPADAEEDEGKEQSTSQAPDEDELPLGQIFGGKRGKKSTKTSKRSGKPCKSEKSELELVKDSPSNNVVKSRDKNGELLLGAENGKDNFTVMSQSSFDSEVEKPAIEDENGKLVHGAATSDKDTCIVDSSQSILVSEAQKPVVDNENRELTHIASKSDKNTFIVEPSQSNLHCEAHKPASDDENRELVHIAATSDKDTCIAESSQSSFDAEAQKPVLDNENRELVHRAATSDKDTCIVESSESSLVSEAQKPVVDNENRELVHIAATNDKDTCIAESSQSSFDMEAQKPVLDNENRELVHKAATSDKDTCVVESSESSLVSEAQKPVVDNENRELVHITATSDKDTCIVEPSELSLVLEAQKPVADNENRELLHIATSDNGTCIVESSQSSLDSEAPKPVSDEENRELVHLAATSDNDTSTFGPEARIGFSPNLDSGQNIACGDLVSKAANLAADDEKGALVSEPISAVESSVDPNLDFEQENTGGDTGTGTVKVSLDDESKDLLAEALTSKNVPIKDLQESIEFNPDIVNPALKIPDGDHDSEAAKPAPKIQTCEEDSPAALILNFSNSESLPSEEYLNKIFSAYGSLNESQTELLKKTNRAKVVFKRRSDAQKAFSSCGKYSTFGPSLESYRLKFPL